MQRSKKNQNTIDGIRAITNNDLPNAKLHNQALSFLFQIGSYLIKHETKKKCV